MKLYKATLYLPELQQNWIREQEAISLPQFIAEIHAYMEAMQVTKWEFTCIITSTQPMYSGFVYEDILLN